MQCPLGARAIGFNAGLSRWCQHLLRLHQIQPRSRAAELCRRGRLYVGVAAVSSSPSAPCSLSFPGGGRPSLGQRTKSVVHDASRPWPVGPRAVVSPWKGSVETGTTRASSADGITCKTHMTCRITPESASGRTHPGAIASTYLVRSMRERQAGVTTHM